MNTKIKRTHHWALRPTLENYEKTVRFYTELLGFTIEDEWIADFSGFDMPCAMLNDGNGMMIEIFAGGKNDQMPIGAIPHICFETDCLEELMEEFKKAGYPSTDPNGNIIDVPFIDYDMKKDKGQLVWRCAFILGPCHEVIELLNDVTNKRKV